MPHRIIVSGIYRSGTSLNAGLIRNWGAYTGREDDVFKDEYGYLEHLSLQKLNDDLLNNNSRVPLPPDEMGEKVQDPILKEQALEILNAMDREAEQNQAVAWVWKDPRIPLVIPFWAQIWGEVIYIIPVRHPVETIISAARMDGLEPDEVPLSAGLAYWQFCMLNVLTYTNDSQRKCFMPFDQLVRFPQSECTRLCHFLDEQCRVSQENAGLRIRSMTSHIAIENYHFQHPRSLAEVSVATREQRALYDFLRVKTMYPGESFIEDDFALYPGWREYIQAMDMLVTYGNTKEANGYASQKD